MKYLVLLFLVGCSTSKMVEVETVEECVKAQVEIYGDLCAEESSGYELMDGPDAHFQGVTCAVESILTCLEGDL